MSRITPSPAVIGPVPGALGAVCLVLGPVAFAVAEYASPEGSDDPAGILSNFATHSTGVTVSIIASLASSFFLLAGLHALLARPLTRGRAVLPMGLALMLWSVVTNTLLVGVSVAFQGLSDPSLDSGQMREAVIAIMANPLAPLALTGHYVMVFAALALGIGFWRAGIGPRWAAVAVAACGLVDAAGGYLGPVGEVVGSILSNALIITGFAAEAWFLVREPVRTAVDAAPVTGDRAALEPHA